MKKCGTQSGRTEINEENYIMIYVLRLFTNLCINIINFNTQMTIHKSLMMRFVQLLF